MSGRIGNIRPIDRRKKEAATPGGAHQMSVGLAMPDQKIVHGEFASNLGELLLELTDLLDLIRRRPEDAARVRRWAKAGLEITSRASEQLSKTPPDDRIGSQEMDPLT